MALALIFLSLSGLQTYAQTYAQNGMVVSSNKLASQVGVDILKKGGNAIDASIATAFALAVTHPSAGNIGGGGFMVYMKADGFSTTIDFREKAPLTATADMFMDKDGNLLEGYRRTLKAVGVPGTVAGLVMAHEKYGSLPWADLVQPAIELAENGFPMPWNINRYAHYLNESETMDKETFAFIVHYFDNENGNIVAPGALWKQPVLAHTLTLIRDNGADGFYKGEVAKEIEEYMKANGGIITRKDLKAYQAVERAPIKGTFKGYDIVSMPPPSSGGVTLVEMLNIMENADFDKVEFNSAEYFHLVAESMRRGFANRAEYLGDPDFNPDMPLTHLLDKAYAKSLYDNIDLNKASVSDSSKFAHPYGGDNTTHLSVIDKEGNAVSLTYTLEHSYGAWLGSDKLGFIFNNEMGDFNPMPGVTSGWMIGTQPNIIAPEKRMLSSMTPTIVAKDGKPYLVIGSPGGRTIINTVYQTILGVLGYDMRVDYAIEATKIHHQWLPDEIRYEANLLSPDTRKQLEAMGHKMGQPRRLGELMGIQVDSENHVYIGAADSGSSNGGAIGY